MFDDIQKTPGQIPSNLPVSEPEDMFGAADAVQPTPVDASEEEGSPVAVPASTSSALGAGILRPKTVVPPPGTLPGSVPRPVIGNDGMDPVQDSSMYRIKEPSIGKGIAITIISAVTVALVGGGGWYIYDRFVRNPQSDFPVTTQQQPGATNNAPAQNTDALATQPVPTTPTTTQGNGDVGSDIVDEKVLFGEPIDSDNDGLDDAKEVELGTDPHSWDTDGDGLSDRDEVIIWKTNALVADTDGDGYSDGLEVKSGYNPNGPGKLFQPPSATSTVK